MTLIPTIFESFNAKFLTPEQVAASFVPPDHFWKLCQPCHTVIVGPRGSGKTSLLKMLQTKALKCWNHPSAEEIRQIVHFIGIFVPTDIVWHMQLTTIGEGYLIKEHRQVLMDTAVTLHVLYAFVSAVIDECDSDVTCREHQALKLNYDQEKRLVQQLSTLWRFCPESITLRQFRTGIAARLADIAFFVADERLSSPDNRTERMRKRGLVYPGFLELIRPAIQIVNEAIGIQDQKWALCFDELELASEGVQATLIRYLRSTEPNIFFKLSMSPFTKIPVELEETEKKAEEDADFNIIPLWYAEKRESNRFSAELASAILKKGGMSEDDPRAFFGPPLHSEDANAESYAPDGSNYKEIVTLAKNDPSYRNYIEQHHIDLSKMHTMDENERARFIRKPLPSVIHRNYFLRFNGDGGEEGSKKKQLSRSRKSVNLYSGWDAIAAVCEGNPRLLKGIITGILGQTTKDCKYAQRNLQWAVIEEARHKFNAKIKTIRITESGKDRGVQSLLEVVGKYFQNDLLGKEFKAEPVASLELDEHSALTYSNAVGFALNAGALVYLPKEETKLLLNNLIGKRFRLCYLLATEYKIPLRIGISITLNEILKRSPNVEQMLLWSYEQK